MPPAANTFVKYTSDEGISTSRILANRTIFLGRSRRIARKFVKQENLRAQCRASMGATPSQGGKESRRRGPPYDMRQTLLSPYVLPPYRGDNPTPSDAQRLALKIRHNDSKNDMI